LKAKAGAEGAVRIEAIRAATKAIAPNLLMRSMSRTVSGQRAWFKVRGRKY